ncbi:uncharacterized protein LOC144146579 [Haemaphysalis longicornis]
MEAEALRNLGDAAVTALTGYYNKCWRAFKLPKSWKDARTVLIPKPSKPPRIDNLRPISLTSCVGKVFEHVLLNRWQRYLEEEGLYPDTMLGFRAKLSTQDAMLLIKHEVLDQHTRSMDNKAVLCLDLQSAFDSAILKQVSRLNMGERTFAYIKDFLTDRTATIVASDIELPSKTLGSSQPHDIRRTGVSHTIYADDITIWMTGGSDGEIEASLQRAVDEIEDQLRGTGLVCSPTKSELLIVPPRGVRRSRTAEPDITLRTSDGTTIPRVKTLRVLGLHMDAGCSNGLTIAKLDAKVSAAIRLIRRVSTRYAGMKEASLLKLAQSFAVPPIPRHMHPEVDRGRRLARAKALTATHATDNGARYVDVARYPDKPGAYAVAVFGDYRRATSVMQRAGAKPRTSGGAGHRVGPDGPTLYHGAE